MNATRVQWKLYALEKKWTQLREGGPGMPTAFNWLKYKHKLCLNCGINLGDRGNGDLSGLLSSRWIEDRL